MRLHLRRRRLDRPERPQLGDQDCGWIVGGRRPFDAYTVGSLVPVAFERYARILHPAWAGPGSPVRWDVVAAWSGRTIHALAQWDFLSRPLGDPGAPCPFVEPPSPGGLPIDRLGALLRLLARYTSAGDRCFVGVWEGYGWLSLSDQSVGDELRLDQRTFLVTRAPIDAASSVGWRHPMGVLIPETPTLVWPEDQAWFVASDVDLDSTYIGGSGCLIEAVLAEASFEAWPADSSDRVSIDSDTINSK
jgi:hypothetical protein